MSHIVTCDIELNDLDAIRAAVKRLGGTWKEGQKTYAWYGRSVGDYPLPVGVTKDMLGRCDHAFGFTGARYEVGVSKLANGKYGLMWDFWESGGLMAHMGNEQAHKFIQAYGVEKSKIEARRKGYSTQETTLKDGSIKLTLSKFGG